MKLSEDNIADRLANWPVARLATVNPDGQAHQVPMVFAWHDAKLWSPIDGKPKRQGQPARVRNILRNPSASVLIDDYCDDWRQLWWIRLEVEIKVLALDNCSASDHVKAQKALQALRAKYPQYLDTPILGEPPTLLEMSIRSMTSWRAT